MKRKPVVLALLALAGSPAMAEDLSPGLWQITMQSRVPADPGWSPPPFGMSQCLTAGDALDPSRLIGSLAVPGVTGCAFTERHYASGNFRFALDCAGSYGLKAKGSVSFGPEHFSGDITTTANLGGPVTEFENRVSGKRVGACR